MFQTIVVFECRGIEPVDFDPRVRGNSCVSPAVHVVHVCREDGVPVE